MDGRVDSISYTVEFNDDGDDDDSNNDGDTVNTSKVLHNVRLVRVTLTRRYSLQRVGQEARF